MHNMWKIESNENADMSLLQNTENTNDTDLNN